MTVGTAALALRRTKQDINHRRPSADVWMGNQNNRMLASLIREFVGPYVELVLHSGSMGPWTQPDNMASCSLSRSGVRYLSRLPRGKASLVFWGTSLRPRISPSSTRHSTRSLGCKFRASQTDSGSVILRFLSIMVAFI